MNCKENKPYTISHVLDLDIDDLASIPDYFIAVRTLEDPSTGATIATPVRVPGARVMPTANLANVVALDTNNSALEVPEGQVLAGYYDNQPGGNIMKLADSTHPAEFLMLGKYTDEKMLVQATGFLNFPNGHHYIGGQTYWLGDNGQPVTDSTITGQKLFKALNDQILNVNGDF